MVGYIYAKCRPYSPNISVLLIGQYFRPVRQTEIWILKSRLSSIEKIKIWYGPYHMVKIHVCFGHVIVKMIPYFSFVNILDQLDCLKFEFGPIEISIIWWTKIWYEQMIHKCGYNHHFSFSLVNITNQSDRLYRLKFRF